MPKCPNCKEEIDHLLKVETGVWYGEYFGNFDYKEDSFTADGNINEWRCPECDTRITAEEEEADKFLGVR